MKVTAAWMAELPAGSQSVGVGDRVDGGDDGFGDVDDESDGNGDGGNRGGGIGGGRISGARDGRGNDDDALSKDSGGRRGVLPASGTSVLGATLQFPPAPHPATNAATLHANLSRFATTSATLAGATARLDKATRQLVAAGGPPTPQLRPPAPPPPLLHAAVS